MAMDEEVSKAHKTLESIRARIVDYKLEVAADHPDQGARMDTEFGKRHEELVE